MRKNYNGSVTQLVDMLHRAIYMSMNTTQQYLDIYLIALSSNKGFLNLKVRLNVESTFCSLARFHNSANLKICNPIILLLNLSITNHSKKSLDIDETMSPQKNNPSILATRHFMNEHTITSNQWFTQNNAAYAAIHAPLRHYLILKPINGDPMFI